MGSEVDRMVMELLDNPLCSEIFLDMRSEFELVTLWVHDRMVSEQVTTLEPLGYLFKLGRLQECYEKVTHGCEKFEIGLATVEE